MGDLDPEEYLAFVGRVIAAFLDEAKKAYERIAELEAELARFVPCHILGENYPNGLCCYFVEKNDCTREIRLHDADVYHKEEL